MSSLVEPPAARTVATAGARLLLGHSRADMPAGEKRRQTGIGMSRGTVGWSYSHGHRAPKHLTTSYAVSTIRRCFAGASGSYWPSWLSAPRGKERSCGFSCGLKGGARAPVRPVTFVAVPL